MEIIFYFIILKIEYDKAPNLSDEKIKGQNRKRIRSTKKVNLIYNRKIIEEIQNKKFNNSKFNELVGSMVKNTGSINTSQMNNETF